MSTSTSSSTSPGGGMHVAPMLLSLAAACRIAGLSSHTAAKLSKVGQFPPLARIGKRRVVSRVAFERWLAEKVGDVAA